MAQAAGGFDDRRSSDPGAERRTAFIVASVASGTGLSSTTASKPAFSAPRSPITWAKTLGASSAGSPNSRPRRRGTDPSRQVLRGGQSIGQLPSLDHDGVDDVEREVAAEEEEGYDPSSRWACRSITNLQ